MLNPKNRRIIAGILTLLIIVTVNALPLKAQPAPAPFVHLFEWKWNDVAQECETFLAPHGYGGVQVSPPNEHAVVAEAGYPWWQRYQPVSYKIESRSGDRAQFAAMVARCHAVGVKIYADAVINHMAAVGRGVGSGGTPFTRYNYPGLYRPEDFHTCRHGIGDYDNHEDVTNCELVGLPDLNTSSNSVQRKIADYLIDLMSLGVDGFRIDAAKHIQTDDLAAILRLANHNPPPFIYQEVIDPGTEAVRKSEYYQNGSVTEFEYGKMLGDAFSNEDGQSLAQLETLASSPRLMPSEKAIVFVDNHDKQRGHGGGGNYLTYKDGKLYDLANVFMLAYPYGVPQVMSSYDFKNSDQGPPSDEQGHTDNIYVDGQPNCFKEWVCEHRRGAIAPMVQFHNQVADAPLMNWWSDGKNQIAFGRGDLGFVVINRDSEALNQTFQTGLSPGFYCNVVAAGECESEVKVNWRGEATVTVEGMGAIAIHKGSKIRGR
jgi:alpha-amylase